MFKYKLGIEAMKSDICLTQLIS